MYASSNRIIYDCDLCDSLIPEAKGFGWLVKEEADVSDTISEIKAIVSEKHKEMMKMAKALESDSLKKTCENIWNFLYYHIQYSRETDEQVHEPARIWKERKRGVDCDDYTIMASCILTCLNIPHKLRLAEYKNKGAYTHIYVVVPYSGKSKKYFTIDAVKDKFDDEHPFTDKFDVDMKLIRLSGIDEMDDIDLNFDSSFIEDRRRFVQEQIQRLKNLTKDQIVALHNFLYSKTQDTYLIEYTNKDGLPIFESVVTDDTIKNLESVGMLGKEDKIFKEMSRPKFLSKEWWKKNGLLVGVVGGVVVFGTAIVISFIQEGNSEEEEEPKRKVEGLSELRGLKPLK